MSKAFDPQVLKDIEMIAREKGLTREVIIDAIKEGMKQAARKVLHKPDEAVIDAEFNEKTGEFELFEFREVVD